MAEKSRIVPSYKTPTRIPDAFASAARAQERIQKDAISINLAATQAINAAKQREYMSIAKVAEGASNLFAAKRKEGNIKRGQELGARMIEEAREKNMLAKPVEKEEIFGMPLNLSYNADEANAVVNTHNKIWIAKNVDKMLKMGEIAATIPEKRQEVTEEFQGTMEGLRDNVSEIDPTLLPFVDELGGKALNSLQHNIRVANHKDKVVRLETEFWNTAASDLETGASSLEEWEATIKKMNTLGNELYNLTGTNGNEVMKEKLYSYKLKSAKTIASSIMNAGSDDIVPLLNERSNLDDNSIISAEEQAKINEIARVQTKKYMDAMSKMGLPQTEDNVKEFRKGLISNSVRLYYENAIGAEMKGIEAGGVYDAQAIKDKWAELYAVGGDLIEHFGNNIKDPVEASEWEEKMKKGLSTYLVQKRREISTVAAAKKTQSDGEALRKWADVNRQMDQGLPVSKEDIQYLYDRAEPNTPEWIKIEDAVAFSSGITMGAKAPLITASENRRDLVQLLLDKDTPPSLIGKIVDGYDLALDKRYEVGDTYYQAQIRNGNEAPLTTTTEIDKLAEGDPVKAMALFVEKRLDPETNKVVIAPNDWGWIESGYADAQNDKDPARQRQILAMVKEFMPQVYDQYGQTETGWLGAVSVADELGLPVPHYTEPAVLSRFRTQNKDKIAEVRDALLRKMPAGHQGRKLADYFVFSLVSKHVRLLPDNGKWLSGENEFDAGDFNDEMDELISNSDNLLIKGVGFADGDIMDKYYDAYYAANPEQKLIVEQEKAKYHSQGDTLMNAARFTGGNTSNVYGDNVMELISDTGTFYLKQGQNMGDATIGEQVKTRIADGQYIIKPWDVNNNNTVYKLFTPEGEALTALPDSDTIEPLYAVFPRSTAAK